MWAPRRRRPMRSNLGSPRDDARTDPRRHEPGSRAARLAEAGKQLSILLEDVDLDAEADLGNALTDAVVAVDRAADLADRSGGEEPRDAEPGARDRLVEDADGGRATRSESPREERPVDAGGLQFVGEAGAE